jgi:hypothetical protein
LQDLKWWKQDDKFLTIANSLLELRPDIIGYELAKYYKNDDQKYVDYLKQSAQYRHENKKSYFNLLSYYDLASHYIENLNKNVDGNVNVNDIDIVEYLNIIINNTDDLNDRKYAFEYLFVDACHKLAEFYKLKKDVDNMIKCYLKMPNNAKANTLLGIHYKEIGEIDNMILYLNQAVGQGDYDAKIILSNYYKSIGDYKKMTSFYDFKNISTETEDYQKETPKNIYLWDYFDNIYDPYMNLVKYYFENNDDENCKKYLKYIIEDSFDDVFDINLIDVNLTEAIEKVEQLVMNYKNEVL